MLINGDYAAMCLKFPKVQSKIGGMKSAVRQFSHHFKWAYFKDFASFAIPCNPANSTHCSLSWISDTGFSKLPFSTCYLLCASEHWLRTWQKPFLANNLVTLKRYQRMGSGLVPGMLSQQMNILLFFVKKCCVIPSQCYTFSSSHWATL